ncbi:hypothetical protein J3459_017825 [Metarhizium acridum]|nr:hypothetical protein J3459_017825 [Metarhizium acridum]
MSQRILIIGTGFAGMYSALAARRLISQNGKDEDIETVVIAPEPTLAVRRRFYEANPATMQTPLGDLFTATGVKFVQGVAKTIDTKMRQVGVVNTGGEAAVEHTFNVDRLHSAIELDEHLHSLPRVPDCPVCNTVIVCGGGFTGIELAAELPARLRSILGQDAETKVMVVERNPNIEPGLGPSPRPEIQKAKDEYGVESKLGVAVVSVDAGGVVTSTGEIIKASTMVWTGGMVATDLTEQIPGDKDALGRVVVNKNLRVA